MQGKLIIPFHFHLDLMCQPYTPNLTANLLLTLHKRILGAEKYKLNKLLSYKKKKKKRNDRAGARAFTDS